MQIMQCTTLSVHGYIPMRTVFTLIRKSAGRRYYVVVTLLYCHPLHTS